MMTLEEFMTELRNDVEKFENHNVEMQAQDSEWPREMSEGDWFEQFLMFVENS